MSHEEFILRASHEGREWVKLLHLPAVTFFVAWHLPQPMWVGVILGFFKKPDEAKPK